MKILVTGAAGFLGNALVRHLKMLPSQTIVGLYHDHEPPHHVGVERWRGDVADYPRMLDMLVGGEIDQIYHCAARSIVRNCIHDPLGCFTANVLGTATLLEAARQSGRIQGVMVMESDKAYGAGPLPYTEDQAMKPGGIYEASKACVSHIVYSYWKNYGLPVFTIRSANVYGPSDKNQTRLIPNTIGRLQRGLTPQLTAGAENFLREFIYVDDFVRYAVGLMAQQPWGEVFNVGSGETHTVVGVVQLICELMGKRYDVEEWSRSKTLLEIPEQVLCLEKLRRYLPDWAPVVPLRAGLERIIKCC